MTRPCPCSWPKESLETKLSNYSGFRRNSRVLNSAWLFFFAFCHKKLSSEYSACAEIGMRMRRATAAKHMLRSKMAAEVETAQPS